jgi:hypothetical protein
MGAGAARRVVLIPSLVANVLLAGYLVLDRLNSPTRELGVLTRDVTARFPDGSGRTFHLPKGMTVRDETPRGIAAAGMFAPYRFAIVVMAEQPEPANFAPGVAVGSLGELYAVVEDGDDAPAKPK